MKIETIVCPPQPLPHESNPYISMREGSKEIIVQLDNGYNDDEGWFVFDSAQARRLAYLLNQAADLVDGRVIKRSDSEYTRTCK